MLRAGLLVVLVSGLGAIPAVQSGERAEEQLEGFAALNESNVETHEEAAKLAQWLALAAAGLALLTHLAMARPGRLAPWLGGLKAGVVVLTAVVLAAMVRTAQTAGPIRHPEVQGGLWGRPTGGQQAPAHTGEAP